MLVKMAGEGRVLWGAFGGMAQSTVDPLPAEIFLAPVPPAQPTDGTVEQVTAEASPPDAAKPLEFATPSEFVPSISDSQGHPAQNELNLETQLVATIDSVTGSEVAQRAHTLEPRMTRSRKAAPPTLEPRMTRSRKKVPITDKENVESSAASVSDGPVPTGKVMDDPDAIRRRLEELARLEEELEREIGMMLGR